MNGRLDALASAGAWRPRLGTWPDAGEVSFRVWAPSWKRVELIFDPGPTSRHHLLEPAGDGMFSGRFADVTPGELYSYLFDGEGPFPDPASRFQPQGVHGPGYVHLLTGETVDVVTPHLPVASVFRTSPVALLWAPD